jgi:hypothetical protein
MRTSTCSTAKGASGASIRWTSEPSGAWFWGVSFDLTKRKSYGHVSTLEAAKAAFRAEYEAWKREVDLEEGANDD